ncbi:hypothetical protein GCM10018987_11480 [Streptomyces cremeus]
MRADKACASRGTGPACGRRGTHRTVPGKADQARDRQKRGSRGGRSAGQSARPGWGRSDLTSGAQCGEKAVRFVAGLAAEAFLLPVGDSVAARGVALAAGAAGPSSSVPFLDAALAGGAEPVEEGEEGGTSRAAVRARYEPCRRRRRHRVPAIVQGPFVSPLDRSWRIPCSGRRRSPARGPQWGAPRRVGP